MIGQSRSIFCAFAFLLAAGGLLHASPDRALTPEERQCAVREMMTNGRPPDNTTAAQDAISKCNIGPQGADLSMLKGEDGLARAFDLAANPDKYVGRRIGIRCVMVLTKVDIAGCPIINDAGQRVGAVMLKMSDIAEAHRQRLLATCATNGFQDRCVVNLGGIVRRAGSHFSLEQPEIAWRDE